MGIQLGSIHSAATNLHGSRRPLSNGVEIDVQREGFPFAVRIEETSDALIQVSAWDRSFLLPTDPQVQALWAFYMQIVNCNSASGRMTWNQDRQCGYTTGMLTSGVVPEKTISRVVEEVLNQLLQVWPGFCEVRKGVSPDAAFVKFIERIQPLIYTPVRRGSPELQFLENYISATSLPSQSIEGGVTFEHGDFRIELTADVSGRFTVTARCKGRHVPPENNFISTFYLQIANANRSLGTMYLSTRPPNTPYLDWKCSSILQAFQVEGLFTMVFWG